MMNFHVLITNIILVLIDQTKTSRSDDVVKNYDNLQQSYNPETKMEMVLNPGWGDDFKFLYEQCRQFRFFKGYDTFPVIKLRKLPSLHNTRWNSRAIYPIYTLIYTIYTHIYFLIPKWRVILEKPCSFISNVWQEAWFSKQMFNEEVYQNLMNSISELNFPGAMKCLITHWNLDKSIIDIPRTNICAERAVKLMEELQQKSKMDKYLTLKFIATNTF